MTTKRSVRVLQYVRGEEKGEDRIGFTNGEFASVRRTVVKEWVFTTVVLCTAILACLSIFWGAFNHVDRNLESLKIWIVNFDKSDPGFVGTHIVQLAERLSSSPGPHVGFEVVSSENFGQDPLNVRRAVYNFEAWAAIVVEPNASSILQQAVEFGNRSYDPTGAAEIIYVQARDTVAIPNYVLPALSQFTTQATSEFGEYWVRSVLQNTSIPFKSLQAAPQALNPAIGFTIVNLRPFTPPQATPAVTVAALYLIIISFFSFTFFLPTHSHFINELEGHRRLFFHHLVIWKYTSAISAYFFMSLAYSFVSLAFQIPFSNPPASPIEPGQSPTAYGHASFFVFWMINWLGMCALGLASENVAMILNPPWPAIWLIFWVISNVCTALYPIELAPRFYYYGYAFPLHNVIEASRQILFDLHSRIGLNVGVLFAWLAVNTAVFPLCAWFFRYKYLKAREKARQKT